jgi:hypothetical protein
LADRNKTSAKTHAYQAGSAVAWPAETITQPDRHIALTSA